MAATIRASTKGLEIVDAARRKKGWAKAEQAWADLALTSVPTLKRFWTGIVIRKETFQKICEVVGITDWESIADFEIKDESPSKLDSRRLVFAIAGTIEEIDKKKLDAIVALLQKLGGDTTIEILDIDEGSIKLILGGSPEALEKIEALFRSGDLNEISEILVQDVHFIERAELTQLINKNGGAFQNLSGADLFAVNLRAADLHGANLRGANLFAANLRVTNLFAVNLCIANLFGSELNGANLRVANLSGANLSWADLSGADLSGANLSGANLSRSALFRVYLYGSDLRKADLRGSDLREADLREANLRGARFANNLGLSTSDKFNMQKRGAIFEDAPESNVPSFV